MDNLLDQLFPGYPFAPDSMRGHPQHPQQVGVRNDAKLQMLLLGHPQFPAIVELTHDIQRQGALPEKQQEWTVRQRQNMAELRSCIAHSQGSAAPSKDESADSFISTYLSVLENYKNDITSTEREVNDLIKGFDAEIAGILNDSSAKQNEQGAGGTRLEVSGLMVNMKDSQLEKELKDKHGEDIMEAQSSFCIKRTRKVLPTAATNVLRKWWKAHFAWPYPTDAEKELISEESGLGVTQVNNWLINQRKRGWHKYFPGGVPKSEEEAIQLLALRGASARP